MPTTLLKNPVDVNVASTSVGLNVSGTAAASTTGAGAKPSNTLTVTGTPGQATTGTGTTAGAGADIVIAAGDGGAAVTGSMRGTGGSVTINPGAPATGAGTGGQYGTVLLATQGGRVGVGTTSPTALIDINGTLPTFATTRISAGNAASLFTMRKANTGMTAVVNGNEIVQWTFSGYDGTTFVAGARVRSMVDGTVSSGNVPLALAFSTGTGTLMEEDGTFGSDENALTERLRISSAGNIGIANPAPTSALHVNGGVQVGAPSGGDMGTGTINVASGFFVNGSSLLDQLTQARQLIAELTARADKLEAEVQRLNGKGK